MKVVSDPVSGNFELVDIGANKTIPLTRKGMQPTKPEKAQKPTSTIWDLADLATGPISGGMAAASVGTGLVGVTAKKTLYARQFVSAAKNDLIRALSINPRYPVGEIKRLEKEIDLEPQIFDNPSMMKQRIKAIDDYLRIRLDREIETSNTEGMPKADRQNALSAANSIKAFLKLLGRPSEANMLSTEDTDLINKYLVK